MAGAPVAPYRFSGHVVDMTDVDCWLRMRNRTDPDMPMEEWCVPLYRLPVRPEVGQYVDVVIDADGLRFEFDQRRWTQEELDEVGRRARERAALFGVEEWGDE